jgi:predicted nucleic acid-binding protein
VIVCDTNVISEPMRGDRANSTVVAWLDRQPAGALYLPAIVLAELRAGLQTTPSGARRESLSTELQRLLVGLFRGRILPFDEACAYYFGEIHANAQVAGRRADFADVAIAATAKAHHFAVATRNTKDFKDAGVAIINPWKEDA